MYLSRRQFLSMLWSAAVASGIPIGRSFASNKNNLYDVENYGKVRLLHFTDCHAQLLPTYYREPNINLGIGVSNGRAPHLVGKNLLKRFNISSNSPLAHAFTYLNYVDAAQKFGKVGGFSHLATLIQQLRSEYGEHKTLLLDGGDTWQGSGTALWTRGKDMVETSNLLGVDVMTGHWEFTYQDDEVLENSRSSHADFVAQNINLTEEGMFEEKPTVDEATGHVFKPYVIKEFNGARIAVVGQAFPYTPIANPKRFIPYWTFGIKEEELQKLVDRIIEVEKPASVILLSHNGMDVDMKLASRVTGITAILGGHTHDGVPNAIEVKNANGITVVTNAGSNGKFLGVLDLEIASNRVSGYRYKLLPIFSNLIPANTEMQQCITELRKPFIEKLDEKLGVANTLLYRRGNFNGTFDQVICNALTQNLDAEISLSPGFRWGTTVLPNVPVSMEDVLNQTAMTYPETYVREMTGEQLKVALEDVSDNLFNEDPYYQQGGDMVRLGGMDYVLNPHAKVGKRITEMTLDNGKKVEPNKNYKVAGWSTVNSKASGPPVWEIVADYIRDRKEIKLPKINTPKLVNVNDNPGIADTS